jgi:glucose-specific phosphotransferase system IIA component
MQITEPDGVGPTVDPRDARVAAPMPGRVVPLAEVDDPAFSEGMLGVGLAIEPDDGIVAAPIDGVVTSVFPTGHAVGLRGEDGLEVLIHVGLDTVALAGRGFRPVAAEGARVAVGDPLLEVDLELIRSLGYPTVTPIVATNAVLVSAAAGELRRGDVLFVARGGAA